jgi:hypothetical protein
MKRTPKRQLGKSAFDVLEEATHLLRTAPVATLATYFLGTAPFVLSLLFFWADMSRSPLAPQRIGEASFGMAALFCWMKFWQVIFARRVRAQAAREVYFQPGFRRSARIFMTQAIIQPSGLFLLPLAAIPILSFPWTYSLYQDVTVLDDGGEAGAFKLLKKASRQARLWPRQNYALIAILFAFAFCVFLNWITACLALPQLFKMLLGGDLEFIRSPLAMLNTTFFAAMLGLTYLCVDPISKTVQALRCFYGESLQSGEDLKAELKPFVNPVLKVAAAILVLTAVFFVSPARADTTAAPAAPPASPSVAPTELDHVIDQTIRERKYAWRMPRDQAVAPDAQDGVITKFFNKMGATLRGWARAIGDWIDKLLRKWSHDRSDHPASPSSGYGWIMLLHALIYVLVAAFVIMLAVLLIRVSRGGPRSRTAVTGEPIQPAPDITDENVRADQLPEDGWIQLARELLARGEFRLAMRAFYLSGLAHLATRNLVSIARFKSNREYERELQRRAHSFPLLLTVFGDSISAFERVWYGMHSVDGELVNQFAANVEKLKGAG